MMFSNVQDASRIAAEKGIDLKDIGLAEARKIMSEEHKALGYRPPHGSLASAAQAAASKHPHPQSNDSHIDEEILRKAALEDAARIAAQRTQPVHAECSTGGINLDAIGIDEARKLMSAEHKALGYRPPPGSLAADAQSAAAKHPQGVEGVPKPPREVLAQEALRDAARIASERNGETSSPTKSPDLKESNSLTTEAQNVLNEHGSEPMTKDIAAEIISDEHKSLGYRPPAGTIPANAQSLADKNDNDGGSRVLFCGDEPSSVAQAILKDHSDEPMTKDIAAELVSEKHKRLGHLPESGTVAPTAQSVADKNENDGGERVLEV